MSETDDLFSFDAQKKIDELEVTSTKRIVIDHWIIINGIKFDAEDVYNTLLETCNYSSESYITDRKMIEALKSLRVIEHGGSGRWMMSAKKGPNYDYFIKWLAARVAE